LNRTRPFRGNTKRSITGTTAGPTTGRGNGLWGHERLPGFGAANKPFPERAGPASGPPPERADAHLRSTQAVDGYHLQASDGIIGHVCDFMMDAQSWAISQLVIKTGHRFSGKEVQIPTRAVARISYPDSTVFVNLTQEAVEQSPAHQLAAVGAPD